MSKINHWNFEVSSLKIRTNILDRVGYILITSNRNLDLINIHEEISRRMSYF